MLGRQVEEAAARVVASAPVSLLFGGGVASFIAAVAAARELGADR